MDEPSHVFPAIDENIPVVLVQFLYERCDVFLECALLEFRACAESQRMNAGFMGSDLFYVPGNPMGQVDALSLAHLSHVDLAGRLVPLRTAP